MIERATVDDEVPLTADDEKYDEDAGEDDSDDDDDGKDAVSGRDDCFSATKESNSSRIYTERQRARRTRQEQMKAFLNE